MGEFFPFPSPDPHFPRTIASFYGFFGVSHSSAIPPVGKFGLPFFSAFDPVVLLGLTTLSTLANSRASYHHAIVALMSFGCFLFMLSRLGFFYLWFILSRVTTYILYSTFRILDFFPKGWTLGCYFIHTVMCCRRFVELSSGLISSENILMGNEQVLVDPFHKCFNASLHATK